MAFIATPNPSGGDIPEPFNNNDVKATTSSILHNMKRLAKPCYHPSDLIMEEEMEAMMAYYNPQVKEMGLYDKRNVYRKLVTYCLERLTVKGIVRKEEMVDESDGESYTVYCTTDLFEQIKSQIRDGELTIIDTVLEGYKARKKG